MKTFNISGNIWEAADIKALRKRYGWTQLQLGRLLLVTDGVCGVIADDGIAAALEAHRGVAVARALIDAAYETGAPDNIGIALLDERP